LSSVLSSFTWKPMFPLSFITRWILNHCILSEWIVTSVWGPHCIISITSSSHCHHIATALCDSFLTFYSTW
jgi:hypothetical protein